MNRLVGAAGAFAGQRNRTSAKSGSAAVAAIAAAACLSFASAATAQSVRPEAAAIMDQMREAFAKYQDVNVALAEGFIPDPTGHCATAVDFGLPLETGTMGLHYLHPERLQLTEGDRVTGLTTNTDPMTPAVLLYEPQADGTMEFLGVELLVFRDPWRAEGNQAPPVFAGIVPWDTMADDPATADIDEAHGFVPHYDLHVWLFRDNPAGPLEMWNPTVTCEHHQMP
ncbi:MAG: hypothetical protein AB7O56_00490 [Bauldia sp.]